MRTHYIFGVANNANNYHKSSAPASDVGCFAVFLIVCILLCAIKIIL